MLLNVARIGGLTAGIVFVSFLGSAADEPATRTSFLTDYQKAFPELEARYSVVQGKGHVLRESHDPDRPQALTKTTFEFARNRDRFKVVSNVRETKNEQGFENDLTRVICYDSKNCFSLIKTRIDDKFRVLTEAESDQKHRFAAHRRLPAIMFPYLAGSESFFNLPNFAKNKTFKLVEDQDVLINGKTRRRILFAYDPGDQDRIPKKAGVSRLLSITFLLAPDERFVLCGFAKAYERNGNPLPRFETASIDYQGVEEGFPIPKTARYQTVLAEKEGEKVTLGDGREVIGKVAEVETYTFDEFHFKAEPEEVFTLKAF